MIYLLMFALSTLLLYLSRKVKKKIIRKICVIAALLLPALLAAFRATSVGTDYEGYGTTFFDRAKSCSSLADFFALQTLYNATDYGFYVIIYFCSLFTDEYMLEMFAFQIITVVFIYFGLCNCEKKYGTPVWLAMLLYYFYQYNASLNIMRQSIAVAIAFYAFTLVWEKRYVLYALLTAMAYTVHSSALLAVAILVLYKFLESGSAKTERKQLFRGVLIVVILIGGIMSISAIVTLLANTGVVNSAFLAYLSGGRFSTIDEAASISWIQLLIQLIYLAVFAMYYRMMNRKDQDPLFFTMVSLVVLIIDTFSPLFAQYIFRMAYYFVPLQMAGLANITLLNKKGSRQLWIALVVAVAFVYWYWRVVYTGGHETMPYVLYWS